MFIRVPPAVPSWMLQSTAVLLVPEIDAVNDASPPGERVTACGEMVMETVCAGTAELGAVLSLAQPKMSEVAKRSDERTVFFLKNGVSIFFK